MNNRVRIKDIAEKAGVSKGTVDRVLHKRGNVSPEARKKVLAAIEELDYQRNIIASALAYNRVWKIAALLPRPEEDPFWQQPKIGIGRAHRAVRDYGVTINFYHFAEASAGEFITASQKILEGDYDAVLVAPIFAKQGHDFLNACQEKGLKYVQINTYLPREDENFLCYIGQDSYQSGMLAAKLLSFGVAEGGTAMILHLEKAVYNSMHLMEKEKGFTDFFAKNPDKAITLFQTSFEDIFDKEAFAKFVQETLDQHPEVGGIFVTTSRAFHLVEALERMDKPQMKVLGFDLINDNLQHLETNKIHFLINQNPLKQGYLAIMNIFNHLVLKKEVQKIQYLPLDVVMRENMQYYINVEEELHLII
ncbi:MAG: substrate-binding domain-containing protein [Saprospiraceae bacterium]|nr:substrate-binding domain-containing protein [Saprospiraceae bacterium]